MALSGRTHTTAFIGGRRMKLACGIVVGGQTSGTQHVALEVPGRSCNALGTTLQKSHNGPGLTATTFMTHRNGSHGSKTANGTTHPLRSPSTQQNFALRSPQRPHGGRCVLVMPNCMCRVRHPLAVPVIGIIGLTWTPGLSENGL